MSTTRSPSIAEHAAFGARLRNAAVGATFTLVLILPKLLHLRRNKHSWLAFRIMLALIGAALVILPLSIWNSLSAAIAGMAIFVAAILLPPAKTANLLPDKAKEMGALVVVNGGEYVAPPTSSSVAVQLVVAADKIHALDPQFHPLLVIPISQISSADAVEVHGHWILNVRWQDHSDDFHYRGVFAEHLARVAESTIRSVLHPVLPVLPQKRAATA